MKITNNLREIQIPIFYKYDHTIMHLSAAILGGSDPREPPVICTMMFTNPPYPKPRLFNKKLLTPLPWGQKLCSAKSIGAIFQEYYRGNRSFLQKNVVAM